MKNVIRIVAIVGLVALLFYLVITLARNVSAAETSDCVQSCQSAMDACMLKCENDIDNENCAEECLDTQDHCEKKCE